MDAMVPGDSPQWPGHDAARASDAVLVAQVQNLTSDGFEALLHCAALGHANAPLVTSLLHPEQIDTIARNLGALERELPDLLEDCDSPLGFRVPREERPRIASVLDHLDPARWRDLHRRAADRCALETAGDDAGWRTSEIYHLWALSAPDRHSRLEALCRERLHAHDSDGCHSMLDAVADAGGAADPLIPLWRGIVASEITHDWTAAEAHFCEVLEYPALSRSLHARTLMELGLLDRFQGRFAEALRHLQESCDLAEASRDSMTLGNALMNMGIACTEATTQGQFPPSTLNDALTYHARSKQIWHERGEPERELRAWNNMGTVYKAMDRLDEALMAYRTALDLTPVDQRFVRNAITHNIAEVEELRGNWVEAEQVYTRALALHRELSNDYGIADALLNLGSVQERQGLLEAAEASYREAITAIESVRARLKAEEARAGFLGTRLVAYERLIGLSLTHDGGEYVAFETVERAKARAFIEMLADQPVRRPQAVPNRLIEREQSLRRGLSHLYRMGLRAAEESPASRRVALLESELEDVYRQMRRLDAQYASCRAVDPLPLTEVQRRLPPGAVLIEYFSSGDEIGCFLIKRASAEVRMLPKAGGAIQGNLPSGNGAPSAPPMARWDHATLENLYAALLAPIEELLDGCEELYLIPHGSLHYVPLHLLGDGAPLLEHYRVSYAPSASVLLQDQQISSVAGYRDRLPCVALGFNGSSLHYAELEARHVVSVAGGAAYTGAEARYDLLRREISGCSTLHLACHGTFNSDAPLASGLVLADGKLDAMTILQELRLRADLVVLSACDTGQAVVLRGDELMGLARAILYAGAASVLVSLWPVDDLATGLLMDAFYRARAVLPPGVSGTAEALRRAQLTLRSMTVEEALSASECLRAATADQDALATAWADTSLAWLHSLAGGGESIPQGARNARSGPSSAGVITSEGQVGRDIATYRSQEQARHPYASPYYWGAFALICRGIFSAAPADTAARGDA